LELGLDGSELIFDSRDSSFRFFDFRFRDFVLLVTGELSVESVKFDLELEFGAFELIDFFGLRLSSDLDCRSGFVETVDSRVGLQWFHRRGQLFF
jgi:hypothetical protein